MSTADWGSSGDDSSDVDARRSNFMLDVDDGPPDGVYLFANTGDDFNDW